MTPTLCEVGDWYIGAMLSAWWPEPIPLGDAGGAWVFPEQNVLYTETRVTTPSAEDVHALFDFFLWIDRHFAEGIRPIIVHDWRSLQTIPRAVRQVFVRRRKQSPRPPARVVVAATVDPIVRMAIRTVALAAQMLVRAVELDLVTDVEPALRDLGVREPDASLHARLRLAWRHAQSVTPPG